MTWVDPARPRPLWLGDYCSGLLADPDWIVEPKYDGQRVLVIDGLCWSRQRKRSRCPIAVPTLPEVLDGEWLRQGVLVVWDSPTVDGDIGTRWDYVCSVVSELGPVRRATRLTSDHWSRAMAMGAEGMVLKRRGVQYPRGNTYQWLKVKG